MTFSYDQRFQAAAIIASGLVANSHNDDLTGEEVAKIANSIVNEIAKQM